MTKRRQGLPRLQNEFSEVVSGDAQKNQFRLVRAAPKTAQRQANRSSFAIKL